MPLFVNGPGSPFPTGTNPVSNATADLNGDGHLDLLVTNYISDNVSVLFGNGNGGFTPQAPVPVGNGPREVEAGNLDGDGDIDFIVSNYSGNSVSVLRNNGNGTFTVLPAVPVGTVPRGLALGDLDGDGDLDFVSANYQSNNLSVMLNNGSAAFAQAAGSPIAVGTRPTAIVLARLDNDNDLDIAVTSNNTNTVSILFNNGNGTFTAGASPTTGIGPRGIAAGDLDGDADTDLVVDNFGATSLTILLNNGAGVFTASPGGPLATGNNPYAVTVGDLDGDGDLDIATTNSGSSSVSVFRNNGAGGFTPADGSPFAVGVSPGGVVMGDFDEDGVLDLSTANFGSNTTSVLINTTVLPPELNHVTGLNFFGSDTGDVFLFRDVGGAKTLLTLGIQNNVVVGSQILGTLGSDWTVDGVGNFDGDTDNDFLLHRDNGAVRELLLLKMEGNTVAEGVALGNVGTEWSVNGAGDFNHDGTSDFLMNRVVAGTRELFIMNMNNGVVQGTTSVGAVGQDWLIDDVRDFNGDGTADILLHRDAGGTRVLEIFDIQNGAVSGVHVTGPFGNDWRFEGADDFNHDGTADILLSRAVGGIGGARELGAFEVHGGTVTAFHQLGVLGAGSQIDSVGDFNNDGTADIAFHRDIGANRALAILEIHDFTPTAVHSLGATGADWFIQ